MTSSVVGHAIAFAPYTEQSSYLARMRLICRTALLKLVAWALCTFRGAGLPRFGSPRHHFANLITVITGSISDLTLPPSTVDWEVVCSRRFSVASYENDSSQTDC